MTTATTLIPPPPPSTRSEPRPLLPRPGADANPLRISRMEVVMAAEGCDRDVTNVAGLTRVPGKA